MTAETDFTEPTDDIDFDYEFVEPPETPEVDISTGDIDSEFAQLVKETNRAKHYRRKVSSAMGFVWRPLLAEPQTIPDAAAFLQYGPGFAKAVGKLADEDARARKICDFVLDGADNPYLGLFAASLPLVLQLMRNHEPEIPVQRELKIPFFRRSIRLRFSFKLMGRFRNMTNEPQALAFHVFSNPNIIEALKKQGIDIAWQQPATPKRSRRRTA